MQITQHVHAVRIPFQIIANNRLTLERSVYAFLIYGRRICLIDTGVASAQELLFDYLKQTGRKPDEISLILHTHTHPDHIGATCGIKHLSNCRAAVHSAERIWLEDVDTQFRERPVSGFHSLVQGSAKVDLELGDGDVLALEEGITLEVFHTPGHSKGSVSLFFHEDRALFSGDAIPISGDMPIYEDVRASVRSIHRMQSIPEVEHLLASWDEPRQGTQVADTMARGRAYLQTIHEAVKRAEKKGVPSDPMALCRQVLAELGLPESPTNPILARSFLAHVRLRHLTQIDQLLQLN